MRTDLPRFPARNGFPERDVSVEKDGSFSVRLPGDRDVDLSVWHPDLVPAADDGRVTVRDYRDDVVLRLEASAEVRARFLPHPLPPAGGSRSYRALFFRGDPGAEPSLVRSLLPTPEAYRITKVEPGRWTLWFDFPTFAPTLVRDVEIARGAELGPFALSEGASLVVRVHRPEGSSRRAWVRAVHTGVPEYERASAQSDAPEIRVPGLGPGTFHVTAGTEGSNASIDKKVEVDGAGEIPLTLDLR